jgi:predicted RNase H-like HicB family nuclease
VTAARSARTRGRCAVWPVCGGYVGALAELACSREGRTDRTDSSAVWMSRRYHSLVDRVVHVPYTVEQDETGWWSAHASLPGGGANGEGQTAEEAVADLREALDGWFAEFGVPDELTITVRDVA